MTTDSKKTLDKITYISPVPEHGRAKFPSGVIERRTWAGVLRSDDLDRVILIVDMGLIANSDAALVMGVWAGRGRIPGVRRRRARVDRASFVGLFGVMEFAEEAAHLGHNQHT